MPRIRLTARERENRRYRIMGMVRGGYSYEEIGKSESLTRERIRQIVAQSLELNEEGTQKQQKRIAIARLEPALQLAARAVAEGRLEGIDRLIKVIDRMDRMGASPGASTAEDYAGARERLIAKINAAAARASRPAEEPDLEEADSDLECLQDVENA